MNAGVDSSWTCIIHWLRVELTTGISDIVYSTSVPMIITPYTNTCPLNKPTYINSSLDS